ncbi:DNA adenine methylase [Rickettsia tamurae]|uniref:Site-specific DNA-methyltransferase (adenine-specific) n=1 Tax=Rickettsia tamurae subsp. buchneri TaxID=1462938 RepID=A0A8E0WMV0_9RICK|nr:Dam family site-specific DNA-(adenine-N6)-methyltransferase [Rickettsia tamurae]KDO03557.1 Modification methylase DpnIIA [Rickettsia tamurae subsp. buchneri]
MNLPASNKPQPFLQWVGGKRKIVNKLIEHIPSGLNNYYEPFLGGGALFFQVKHMFNQCFLSDINLDLVTSYNSVKKDPATVSSLLKDHKENHSKEYYYQVRDHNNTNDPSKITARFIYLTRYAFKGIYRIKMDGKPAVSFSSKKHKNFDIDQRLQQCSSFLANTSIYAIDFSFIEPKANDFVYLDPPYHQSGERFYTKSPFDENEQIRLRDFAKELNNKGVKTMISNSDTPFIRDLYQGFNIRTVDIKYSIPQQRKISYEVIITNYLI